MTVSFLGLHDTARVQRLFLFWLCLIPLAFSGPFLFLVCFVGSGGLARGAGGANAPPADTKRRAPKLRQGANIPKLLKKIFYSR